MNRKVGGGELILKFHRSDYLPHNHIEYNSSSKNSFIVSHFEQQCLGFNHHHQVRNTIRSEDNLMITLLRKKKRKGNDLEIHEELSYRGKGVSKALNINCKVDGKPVTEKDKVVSLRCQITRFV